MFPAGSFNPALQSGTAINDSVRLRMANMDVLLAVAESAAEAPVQPANGATAAKVIAVEQDHATATANRVQVEVAGKFLWVRMLQTPQVGEQVALRFTDQATLTAESARLAASATTAAAAEPASAAATQTSSARFSAFGNLINQLLSRISAQPEQPAQLPPFLSAASASAQAEAGKLAPHLASGMHQAIEKSGLFYESHLEAWVRNERNLEQIRQEPQARLNPAVLDDSASAAQKGFSAPDHLLPILREQMQVLEQRQFTAQVEVWPRQTAQLTIADEGAPDAQGAAGPRWRAQLKLRLPTLGEVDATLQLQDQGVQLTLQADSAASADRMRTQGIELQEALQLSGLQLTGFKVAYGPGLP